MMASLPSYRPVENDDFPARRLQADRAHYPRLLHGRPQHVQGLLMVSWGAPSEVEASDLGICMTMDDLVNPFQLSCYDPYRPRRMGHSLTRIITPSHGRKLCTRLHALEQQLRHRIEIPR